MPKIPPYISKYNEAVYNLDELSKKFKNGEDTLSHSINNFLGSAQSIIWVLNKSFSKCRGYADWQSTRTKRLSDSAKIFKDLRNISVKEGPVENTGMVVGYEVPAGLPAYATFEGHWIDSVTGEIKGVPRILDKDGNVLDLEIIVLHDFSVVIVSDGKTHRIDNFILQAREYLETLKKEITATVEKFTHPRNNY